MGLPGILAQTSAGARLVVSTDYQPSVLERLRQVSLPRVARPSSEWDVVESNVSVFASFTPLGCPPPPDQNIAENATHDAGKDAFKATRGGSEGGVATVWY